MSKATRLSPEIHLGRILDLAFDEIYVFDAHTLRFIDASRGALDNLGYTLAELTRLTPFDIKPDMTPQWWQELVQPLWNSTRKLAVFQTRHQRKDGSCYPVELRLQLLQESTPPVFIAIVHDITERQRNEDALRASERRYRDLMEQSPFGIQIHAPDGRILMVNSAWERITGARLEDMRDYNILQDRQLAELGILPYVERAFQGEAVVTPPVRYDTRKTPEVPVDSGTIYTRTHLYPIKDEAGRVQEVILMHEDVSDQMAAQQALAESQRMLRLVLDTIPVRVFWKNRQSRYLGCNRLFAADAGLDHPDEIIGKDDHQLNWQEQAERFQADDRAVITSGEARLNYEEAQSWPDGTTRILRTSKIPLRNERDEVFGVLGCYEDITERKAAEAALRASEQRFHTLAKISPVGIFRTDAEGGCIYVNERWCAMAGMKAQEAVGNSWVRALHPEDRERVLREWQEAAARRSFHTECRFQRPDGTVTWLLAQADAECDSEGRVMGYVGTITDITERKRVEEAIQHIASGVSAQTGEAFFHSLVIHLGKLFQADHAFVGLYQEPHQVRTIAVCTRGRIAGNFVYPLEGTPCAQLLNRETCYYPHGVRQLFPRDRLLQELAIESYLGTPVMDRAGRPLGLIVILNSRAQEDTAWIHPILEIFTARTAAELERLQALAELERHRDSLEDRVRERTEEVRQQARIIEQERSALAHANRELESFAYSVSHDLRAPLRAINGFAQALEEDYGHHLNTEGRDYLRRIRRASERMGQLIDDLLMLSRVSRHQLRRQRVDLSALAQEVAAELRQLEPHRRVALELESHLTATGDPLLLRIVLENLLGNAWKYTRKQPHPRVRFGSCTTPQGETAFYVQDNGAGFDMRYADKLFVAFQRLHHLHEYEGTGIGLATVARIVQRHGGRVWAEGVCDRGATFYFTLNAHDGDGEHPEEPP